MKTNEIRQPLRAVAQIRKSFGVRGEMKIVSYSRTSEELQQLNHLYCGASDHRAKPCEIEAIKTRGEELYVKLRGIDDKTAADLLRGQYLFVEESMRVVLPKEKFFIDEIIGCAVVDERGTTLGTVRSVDAYPAQMVYTVRTASGDVMLPAVREFIVNVDVDKKEIVVRPPEGLFDGAML